MATVKTRIDLVGGPLCGADTVLTIPDGALPAVYRSTGGYEYLRTGDHTAETDQHGRRTSTGRRRYEYVVPAALRGLPRPKRDKQCCQTPGHGCPTWGPQ